MLADPRFRGERPAYLVSATEWAGPVRLRRENAQLRIQCEILRESAAKTTAEAIWASPGMEAIMVRQETLEAGVTSARSRLSMAQRQSGDFRRSPQIRRNSATRCTDKEDLYQRLNIHGHSIDDRMCCVHVRQCGGCSTGYRTYE